MRIFLRESGHDVTSVIEVSPGTKDQEVLAWANVERRILLTFDRDYGELIYRLGLPGPAGVMYFRSTPATPDEPAEWLIRLINLGEISLPGMFTVIERDRIRQRPLPISFKT